MPPVLLALLLFSALMLYPAVDARAQSTPIQGRVLDAQTGEGLVAASLLVEGTQRGTITNDDGAFALRLDALPARVLVRYLGYEALTFEVVEGQASYTVRLRPAALEMAELVVSTDNPAVGIMRRVIDNKKVWRADLDTYRAEAYTRLVVRNDTGIVQVEETLTDVFWKKDGGFREIVRGRRKSANSELDEAVPAAALVRNLYDDDVEIAGFDFVGVTHPDALDVYDFRLRGTRMLGEQTVYDIDVAPRKAQAVAFVGRVSVLGEVYALLDAELEPGPVFRFPVPFERYEVRFAQQFYSFGTEAFLPIDFRAESVLKIRMPGILELPAITVEQVSRLSEYAVNVPVPDSLYARRDALTYVDSAAVRADSLLDVSGVRVPLAQEEQAALAGIDSTQTLDKAFKPTGLAARFVQVGPDDGAKPVSFDFDPAVWYNRVEALHAGGAATLRVRRVGSLRVEVGYETGLRDVRYAATTRLRHGPGFVEGSYDRGVAPRYGSDVQTPLFNSLDVLLNRGDYFDYTRRERVRVALGYAPRRSDWTFTVSGTDERHRGVEAVREILTAHGYRAPRGNPDLTTGTLRRVGAEIGYGGAPEGLGFIPLQRAALAVEQASEVLGSSASFGRVYGTLDWGIPTLARRRFLPARLEVRLTGQYGWGKVPAVYFGHVDAAQRFSTPFGTLRTRQPLPYLAPSHAALHWEHNFRTLPFEAVGWDWATRKNLSVLVHGGAARTWGAGRGAFGARPTPSGGHHELGLGLSGLFTYFRLDVTARLDEPAVTVGIAPARIF